jgi:hypothetical protein
LLPTFMQSTHIAGEPPMPVLHRLMRQMHQCHGTAAD